MSGSARPVQNTLAVGVGVSAFVGFIILNLASEEIVGLPLAAIAGSVSGILNSIFHSLPVQRADMPKSFREGLVLFIALLISTAGTGYVYASSEASVKKVISDSPFVTIPIASAYQASYALPITFLLYAFLLKLLGCKQPNPKGDTGATTTAINGENVAAVAAADKDAVDAATPLMTGEPKDTNVTIADEKATPSHDEVTALLAQTKTPPTKKTNCGTTALKILSYAIASGLWISFAAAAFQLYQPKAATTGAAPLSAVSKFYQPIYGTNFYLTLALHIPVWLLAAWGTEEGSYAGYHSIADLAKNGSIKKGVAALLVLGILALTSIATYLISSYGKVNTALMAIAMIAAIISNYVPATISSDATVKLGTGHPQKAIKRFTAKEPVTSFFASKKLARTAPTTGTTVRTGSQIFDRK